MHRIHRFFTGLLLLSLIILLGGWSCSDKAAQVSLGAAASVKAFQQAEINLHNLGKVSEAEHQGIQQALKQLALSGQDVNKCIGAGGGGACVDPAIAVTKRISLEVMKVKNAESQHRLTLLTEQLQLAFNNLKLAL